MREAVKLHQYWYSRFNFNCLNKLCKQILKKLLQNYMNLVQLSLKLIYSEVATVKWLTLLLWSLRINVVKSSQCLCLACHDNWQQLFKSWGDQNIFKRKWINFRTFSTLSTVLHRIYFKNAKALLRRRDRIREARSFLNKLF